MRQLHTALFFEGEPGNASDPALAAVPPARRALLVAKKDGPGRYRFDIRLRGADETPFFDD
jgi:protocatechuate 3,4-dioxygenase alpha subunit